MPGQSRALLAAPGPAPAWPSRLVSGLSMWFRPVSLGLASTGCSGGAQRGLPRPPSVEAGARPSHLGWPGAGRPLAAGCPGLSLAPGSRGVAGEQSLGRRGEVGGTAYVPHFLPSELGGTTGVGGVALPEQQGQAWRQCPQRRRVATVLPTPLSRLRRGLRGPRGGHGCLRRGRPCPWLQQQRLVLGFGGCACAPTPGDRAPSGAGYVSTPPTAGSWELPCTSVTCGVPGSPRCLPSGSPQPVPTQTLPSRHSGLGPCMPAPGTDGRTRQSTASGVSSASTPPKGC